MYIVTKNRRRSKGGRSFRAEGLNWQGEKLLERGAVELSFRRAGFRLALPDFPGGGFRCVTVAAVVP